MTTRIIRYFMLNTFFSLCLYFGFFQGIEKAQTMAYVIAWICIGFGICAMFMSSNEKVMNELASKAKEISVSSLREFNFIFDLSVIAVFIHADAWVTAGFYLFHMLILLDFVDKVNKIREVNVQKEKDIKEEKKMIQF